MNYMQCFDKANFVLWEQDTKLSSSRVCSVHGLIISWLEIEMA